jgi:UDP-glucose 4-epimerase
MDIVRQVTGINFTVDAAGRRPGDPPYLVGDPAKLHAAMGWVASHDIVDIVASAWEAWQFSHHAH